MQLNALFCCLWRNVEASCHKHFFIFSRNQHRRLLPAMCHNLRYGGRGPPATVLTTPTCCSVNSIAVKKPDIGSESRFLPTPPAFNAPFRGFPSENCYAVWHGKTRMVWLPDGKKFLMICLFVLTEFTNVTDKQTPHDDIGRACIASRGKKEKEVDLYSAFIVVHHTQGAQARITQFYLEITPYLPPPSKRSPDGTSPD